MQERQQQLSGLDGGDHNHYQAHLHSWLQADQPTVNAHIADLITLVRKLKLAPWYKQIQSVGVPAQTLHDHATSILNLNLQLNPPPPLY